MGSDDLFTGVTYEIPCTSDIYIMIQNRRAHNVEVHDAELQVGRNNVDKISLGFTLGVECLAMGLLCIYSLAYAKCLKMEPATHTFRDQRDGILL